VSPLPAVAIGLIAGAACAYAVGLKFRLGYDDSLDVVGVHLVGGVVGALLTGVFADLAINEAGAAGLLTGGGADLLGRQVVAIAATLAFSGIMSFGLLKLVDVTIGLRVTEDEELAGLDLTQHSEAGYAFTEGGALTAPAPPGQPAPAHVHATLPRGSEA
jgi:ammonium transporter, Amt family